MTIAMPASVTAARTAHTLLIGGTWRAAAQTMTVTNPFTGETLANVAAADEADALAAVGSAQRGAAVMRGWSSGERSRLLHRAADALARDAPRFAEAIMRETGKPIGHAWREVGRAVNTLRLSAEEAVRLAGETLAFDSMAGGEGRSGFYLYEPVGVVVAITPFNDPLNLICHKLGPAFAAGNAVILKPAEQAPLVAVMLAHLLIEVGLHPEALNVLTGRGEAFGATLVGHSGVAMVSFTGGGRAGQRIAAQAGTKRLAMELGANSPVIVAADADLDKAAAACASGAFSAAGQNCIGVQRIYVAATCFDAFAERMVARTKDLIVGDPSSPDTQVGPMIGVAEAQRLARRVEQARTMGGRVLAGGTHDGALFAPTVIESPPDAATLVCEEAFGPVVSLFPFDDLDEAIDRANAPHETIHAAIFTESLRTALHAVRRLAAAGVMINDSTDYRLDAMPFGGAKRGNMGREGVRFAVREMSMTKTVCFNAA
ncbi:aldehyde dehydrogenase family protein [Sphingomonas sp. AR_OL41]|uniref:aldehyde dehydrogenase family protein n=1 Tax=Sphingomonas sp. AR_OL41 TaxID=3042729 RepID=UPI00248117CF|nr:aldehyde dehydrogenase family protein [Sphingomonas sp. AR_OL41]MDH7972104.1 aldehyde dehydrogenase family protein [Sphingomonas sp. AR_OL41]